MRRPGFVFVHQGMVGFEWVQGGPRRRAPSLLEPARSSVPFSAPEGAGLRAPARKMLRKAVKPSLPGPVDLLRFGVGKSAEPEFERHHSALRDQASSARAMASSEPLLQACSS